MATPEAAVPVIRVIRTFADVDRTAWDSCANPPGEAYNPFVSHGFLSSLEECGSAVPEAGWYPQHLVLEAGDGTVLGAAPCYAKSHSQGEYVFDHGWAEAWHRAGGHYYPKLQISVPFTPATGPRLLVPPGPERATRRLQLAAGVIELTRRMEASSAHITFLTEDEASLLEAPQWLARLDTQFHWLNQGYDTFDDFLASLASRKRKMIRKERARVAEEDLTIDQVTGADITEAHWDAFFDFYMDTGGRKWGRPYLTRKFFSLVGERMAEHILLVMVTRAGRPIAGALNFIGSAGPLRAQLGRRRAPRFPALRGLLLPGHRFRHRPSPAPRRSRRARTAQAGARLSAGHHPVRPSHRRSRLRPRRCRLSGARAPGRGRGPALSRRAHPLPPRGRELTRTDCCLNLPVKFSP